MPEEGLPSRPLILFWSGDIATLIRYQKTRVNNVNYYVIAMTPSKQMFWRYPNLKAEVKNDILVKEYPEDDIHNISFTPELPVLVALCNFDGTSSIDTEIHKLKNEIKGLKKDIQNYLGEIETLREKYKEQTEYIAEVRGVQDG